MKLTRFKPAVSRLSLLLLSALLWTAIGSMLMVKGGWRLRQVNHHQWLVVIGALATGTLKSYVILDRVAGKGVRRILAYGDSTCMGAVYSIKTWLLVLCMMALGVMLRSFNPPAGLLSFITLAIGWALVFSSRNVWRVWWHRRTQ